MKAAGLIESPRRGVYRITNRGRARFSHRTRRRSASQRSISIQNTFRSVRATARQQQPSAPPLLHHLYLPRTRERPNELIEEGYLQLRTTLVATLRERIAQISPEAFEQLVIDVLTAMGYGGTQEDAALVVGRSGDGGIDGVIKEDRLGLEIIYVQAKRWENTVGRPDIQRFAGALQGQRARKGVFITSSSFSADARAYAASIQTTIVLVDGAQLAELMIDHNVGVTLAKRVEIKRIDSDYFAED
jgi:restriction system protein